MFDVLLATNEPWGTYHATPLLGTAEAKSIRLRQWCPDTTHLPADHEVEVTCDPGAPSECELLVVNGLWSEHTVAAVRAAQDAGVPVVFSELAYVPDTRAAVKVSWEAVGCISSMSRRAVALAAGVDEKEVTVTGWAALDNLPARETNSKLVLALPGVSARDREANQLLSFWLPRLDAVGYELLVRPHPREQRSTWSEWQLHDSAFPLHDALARARAVIGVPGSATLMAAAMGLPFIGLPARTVPAYLHGLTIQAQAGDDIIMLIEEGEPPSKATVGRTCGPIGEAATATVDLWLRALTRQLQPH